MFNLKNLKIVMILSLLSLSFSVMSYVQNRTQSDSYVHWTNSVTTIDIFLNPANIQGFSTAGVQTQTANSIAQWNGKSRITIRQNPSNFTGQQSLNEIYFSTDPAIFGGGSGVVGLTQVLFKNNTGEILEADILLNDDFTFSASMLDADYLGNVITHEMGHFLGLGHSQVSGATMFYSLSLGQNQLEGDDKAGVYSIYPTVDSTKGSITGKIVGGPGLASVFGAHVQAISLKTGVVAAASISEIDGRFTINGIDRNDQYYIYTSPIAIVGLPSRYDNARFDFCNSSLKYRGSFFQGCGLSEEGFPQTVPLNSSQVDVGNITIRCGLDVPVSYISKKNDNVNPFDLQDGLLSDVGNSFVGYYSSQELAQVSTEDKFQINYSGVSTTGWSNISSSGDLYLELKVLNQSFYSGFKANVSVTRPSGAIAAPASYVQKPDGWLNIETIMRIPINRAIPSENDFEVSIIPEDMSQSPLPLGLPFSKYEYFPASYNFEDSLKFYLVSASIVKDNGNSTFSLVSYKNKPITDNSTCPDAINTYALTNFSATGSAPATSKKKSEGGVGCGTVDMSGGSGNGPGGFFIGLILSLIFCTLASSIIKVQKQL